MWGPRLQPVPPGVLQLLQGIRHARLQNGELELSLDVRGGGELVYHGVPVDLNAVLGQVAGQPALPNMGLVIGPSLLRIVRPANILQATRTGYDVHTMEGLAGGGLCQGEASARQDGQV